LSLLHTHLKVGGSIVLNNTFLFLGTVIKDLKQFNCTSFSGVPSHFQILLKKSKSFAGSNFPDLKYFTQAGGKLHDLFIKEIVEKFPNINLFIMYGQTEATARLSYLPPDKVETKMGSVGKGIPDVDLKIVDKNDEEVRVGEIGEIIAKGPNIMLGYLNNRPDDDPIKNGWLYTGDLGKRDEDGFIYITARKKEIIKIGGKRVSPKEVEEVILTVQSIID
jgi:acyl-CoA synthetase (AMP-forming)/AMP-acid ligase II